MFQSNAVKKKLIVIGNGMVGYKFCEKAVENNLLDEYEITVFGEEHLPAYDRVHLSEYFSGKTANDLIMAPFEWYDANDINLYLNEKVVNIDRVKKEIVSGKRTIAGYDKIVFATGSYPFVPPIEGRDKKGVFVYRTIKDLDKIIEYSQNCKNAAVIGGGLLGLEAAKALVDLKLKTNVIEFAPYLMPRQLDQRGSEFLISKIEELGVCVKTNKNTECIFGDEKVEGMKFKDGEVLDVQMVVISAGIKPRDEIASAAGLIIGERGGIRVNSFLQTSDPDIYAIGECALYNNMIYGLVAPGYRMAETVVLNLLGKKQVFNGTDMSTKLKLMGVEVASFGEPLSKEVETQSVVADNEVTGIYKKLVIEKKSSTLLGGILVGDSSDYGGLLQICNSKTILPKDLSALLVKPSGNNDNILGDIPDSGTVCNCENVTKGKIKTCITNGAKSIEEIQAVTKAGTGCGGCIPLATSILNKELEKSGVKVDKSLCEHFAYTRQELVKIIKEEKIESFEELLSKYGKGSGCEKCKPAVASILASYYNRYILNHQTIQDTNDYFLANIQKNGSYSVIPRIPGGEVLPEQLIEIGKVAKEFNLFTKITGGQRIDMLGARLEDLPTIWKRLIAVGLESGHAYAKALRTVKSCVGSTWCRFGVQDSLGLAIELENRYKGLRSPHKIKSAVSGCTRECAEAQGKDFGVIATDKGYNLFICGNGGMKPKHGVLFAEDLDKETVIKYVDRFLMFYIRTADKLTRTATWLENFEGGIERLKEILIHDDLGICEELEKEMKHQINSYKCEWKATLEDQTKLKRFRSFINTNEKDPTIKFAPKRGQVEPLITE